MLSDEEIKASGKSARDLAAEDLKVVLSGLTKHLFGDVEMKFVDAYFPFTVRFCPSLRYSCRKHALSLYA